MHWFARTLRSRLAGSVCAGLLLLASMLTTGCVSVDAVIHVNPDGSGTLTNTITVQKAFVAQLKAMMAMGAANGETPPPELFSEESLKQMAQGMGEGVRLVSSDKISNDTAEGAHMVFAFNDVSKLRAGQALNVLGGAGGGGQQEPMHFRFERSGGRSVLTAELPQPKIKDPAEADPAEGEEAADQPVDPQQMAMISQMFSGLRVAMTLEVGGTLVKTNARYVEGNRITLMEIDFDRILATEGALENLMKKGRPGSVAELQAQLEQVPGIKVSVGEDLRVEFK